MTFIDKKENCIAGPVSVVDNGNENTDIIYV